MEGYEPRRYWDERLATEPNLRGTGHQSYDEAYNRWLYRRKQEVLADALAGLARGSSALDLGSGTGWVMRRLQAAGASRVDGVDISPSAIARLADEFPDATLLCHALGSTPLPVPDGSYDLVTMMDVAYHITDDQTLRAAIRDVARIVRGGGNVVITDEFGDAPRSPAVHVRFRSLGQWQELVSDAGLLLTRLEPLFAWLSRDVHESRLRHLPDRLRGGIEYLAERALPRAPHLRIATFRRAA